LVEDPFDYLLSLWTSSYTKKLLPSRLKPYPAQIILDDLLKEIPERGNLVRISAQKRKQLLDM